VRRYPVTRLQEAVIEVERSHTPWNVQFEAATTATLDAERLAAAARTACGTYPAAKARLRPVDGDPPYEWVLPDAPPEIPVEVVDGDDADLAAVRRRFYGKRFDLAVEPPLSLLVIRGDGEAGGDRLCACASHVSMDGIGVFRVFQALLAAYRGEEPTAATLEGTPREVLDGVRPRGAARRLRLLGSTARRLGYFLDSPARPVGSGPSGSAWTGWWFADRHLDADATARLVADRPAGVTVNDVLLAALHLTVDRWNAARGAPADRISLLMPTNVRPEGRFYDGVGMYTLFDSVDTGPRHRRDQATALERVADRTDRIKAADRQFGYLEWWHLFSAVAPPAVRRRVAPQVFGPGEPLLDTAVLSNLGRVPEPGGLPDGDLLRPWLTPPCWPPTPLSVGVLTVGDRLHLGFRFERSVFDAGDAEAFADRYRERLEGMV
jgi:NRPS condensation-like uncharacterized protein